MPDSMQIYVNGSGSTQATVPARALKHTFAWVKTTGRAEPQISPRLAAEIREALAAVERGEADDLGDFSQYADDED
jgi:hypothetical protein